MTQHKDIQKYKEREGKVCKNFKTLHFHIQLHQQHHFIYLYLYIYSFIFYVYKLVYLTLGLDRTEQSWDLSSQASDH